MAGIKRDLLQFVQCLSCDFGHVHVQCTLGGHSKREGLEGRHIYIDISYVTYVTYAIHSLNPDNLQAFVPYCCTSPQHCTRFTMLADFLSVVAVGHMQHLLLSVVSQTFAQVDSHAHVWLQQGQGM